MADRPVSRSAIVRAIPLYLVVPVAFGPVFVAAGHPPAWTAAAVGALGWVLALMLRAPVGLLAMRATGSPTRAQPWIVVSSGPLEEGVRVVAIVLMGRDLTTALWLGLGWAAVEVVYAIVNGLAVSALAERDDPEAREALAMLPPAALSATPAWGALERVYASAMHIGFTLIAAAVPLAVLITAVVHSGINIGLLALIRRTTMAVASLTGIAVGAALLIVGLGLHLA